MVLHLTSFAFIPSNGLSLSSKTSHLVQTNRMPAIHYTTFSPMRDLRLRPQTMGSMLPGEDLVRDAEHALAAPRALRPSMVDPGTANLVVLIYGLFVTAAGIWAYARTKSNPSLISGIVSGIIFGFAYLTRDLFIALAAALVLSLVFTLRVVKTKAFFPSGLLCVVSVAAAIFFAVALYA